MKFCLVFSHGWGFDKKFWNILGQKFSRDHCIFLDQGYFGQRELSIPDDGRTIFIGIGHSLGLIKLLELEVRFSALVAISGFLNFLGYGQPLYCKRSLELENMKRHFEIFPFKTLQSFYARCKVECQNISALDKELLRKDLNQLSLKFDLPKEIPLLVLSSKDDVVVPPELIRDNFKNARVFFHDKGGHGLNLFNCEFIFTKIMALLDEIKEKRNPAKI